MLLLRCGDRLHLSPEERYQAIERWFVAGNLVQAEAEAQRIISSPDTSSALWAWKFRLQLARIDIYQGRSREALALLKSLSPGNGTNASLLAQRDGLLGLAYARLDDFEHAGEVLQSGMRLCPDEASKSQLHLSQGVVYVAEGRLDDAEQAFLLSLTSARASHDEFQQTQALLNLGVIALRQDHYEDSLQRFTEAAQIAGRIGARQAQEKAEGNAGSTLYRMGDFQQALRRAEGAESEARRIGSPIDQAAWMYDAGMVHYRTGNIEAAHSAFEQSYKLASSIQNSEETVDALFALASLSLMQGDVTGSLERVHEAQRIARQGRNPATLFEPTLLEAQALARKGQAAEARGKLLGMLASTGGPAPRTFERWQIESTLAKLATDEGDRRGAEKWFQRAIGTFQLQRESLSQIDSKLPFSGNGADIYLDYMEELLHEGRTKEALTVLDRSRAATLAEGPSAASTAELKAVQPWANDPQALARRLRGTILVYCLRPHTSYLWAIAPNRSIFIHLPGVEVLHPLIESHTRAITSGMDVLAQYNTAGAELYNTLIQPVSELIPRESKVYLIADGELNHLNFETLFAPGAQPHFWIEDVDVVNAKSLSLLASRSASAASAHRGKELLLVGDPTYSRPEFAKLPNAAQEVAEVARPFPWGQRTMLTGPQATRSAYLTSRPGDYRYIHFVAHATASELNPLDSAVVLSAQPGQPDVYKLYARDIIDSSIHADLVTLSACYGSGVRTYSGEGLVGLAWAFLRAGSHNVVGALWDVSDVSTPRLMGDLYDSLAQGRSPDVALRAAKLKMIRQGNVFRKPFYWAAFQLYSDS